MGVDRGEEVPVKSLDQAAVVVAASLLYKNWQRPGEVVNATLDESKVTCSSMAPLEMADPHDGIA